ncbi:cytochrome c oxidase subunit II [Bremerella alba]|uniref:Cytochrome c oxidase subunit 2 n=1 Tax=Bremerella alba TaxID=980252 RepID=A0A7V8V554_9BACT|nr:cytochrome c oxidase subunit II [Bremerella alba]MBA2115137.1 cytochrome c oxidase subunit 2 [Bremerella alba]
MESTFPVFDPASPQAESIRDLFVQVLFISGGIFAIVAGLICFALYRFRVSENLPVQDFGSHRREIAWMVGPVIIVVWIAAISIKLILTVNALPVQYVEGSTDGIDLIVTGHQWWWEVEYPASGIVSANEIHIPTGKKLRVALRSEDVIHSFWVAQLTRKMDAIPGHENFVWLEASTPGTYQGRCAEYCGTQHAWMNFLVIAHEPADFEAWQKREKQVSTAPDDQLASAGEALFMKLTCSQCHAISGTEAKEDFAPDLTHLASRAQLGAGVLKNTPEELRTWLANPQAVKPGCKMPNFKLKDEQLDQLVAYLETLR